MTRGWLPDLRDWSITTGGGCKIGGGGACEVLPLRKGGGAGQNIFTLSEGGGGAQKVSDP